MRYVLFLVLPLLLQVGVTLVVMFGLPANGTFVPLYAMLLGPIAVLLTALINGLRIALRKTPITAGFVLLTIVLTLIWPASLLALHILMH